MCHNESPSSDVVGVIEEVEEEQGRMSDRIVDNWSKLISSEGEATCIKVELEDISTTLAMPNRKCQDVKEVIVLEEIVCSPPKNKLALTKGNY